MHNKEKSPAAVTQYRAEELLPGDIIKQGEHAPLYVERVSTNSLGNMLIMCSYTADTYPGLTLILPPDEILEII